MSSPTAAPTTTAQHTVAFAKDTSQTSYMVSRMLKPVKWLRCTKDEAKYWEDAGYDIFNAAGHKSSLKFAPVHVNQQGVDPTAFASHFEQIANAENALEVAGISATHDEGLMHGANESESTSSESSSDVFDKPMEASKTQASPKDKGKGNA